ncbi:MAG: redoxin domain-containing protein [Haloarculaceae archaeon]
MLSAGEAAPTVTLPGYVDGERTRVDLGEYVGEGIVVLAFYPADFNPGCSMQSADLGDLDLFTMQKDVSVFGISPDSTYSHEAFAERYGLNVPLLSDVDRAAAEAYGVTLETDAGERLCQRAVFVVDHRGVVQYAWATDDLEERVDVDPVKRAVSDVGGDETALERYRVGYDRYDEGREAFTAAMADYEDREWVPARGGFDDAQPAFAEAADHFDTAVRFAETSAFETVADRAEEKADTLQHAAQWLSDSADALGGGRGRQGDEYREDAQRLLSAAEDLPEPPAPDAFALTGEGIDLDDSVVVDPEAADRAYAYREGGHDGVDADLDVDDAALDAAAAEAGAGGGSDYDDDSDIEGDAVEGDLTVDVDAVAVEGAGGEREDGGERAGSGRDGGDEADADGATAIEGDTVEGDVDVDFDAVEAAAGGAADPGGPEGDADSGGAAVPGPGGGGSDAGAAGADATGTAAADGRADAADRPDDAEGGDGADEPVEELDLADPTEGEDEDEDEDERADWDIPGR